MLADPVASHERRRNSARLFHVIWMFSAAVLVIVIPADLVLSITLQGLGLKPFTVPVSVRDLIGASAALATLPSIIKFCTNHTYTLFEFEQSELVKRFLAAKSKSLAFAQELFEAGIHELGELTRDQENIRRGVRFQAGWHKWGGIALIVLSVLLAGTGIALMYVQHADPTGFIWAASIPCLAGTVLWRFARKIKTDFPEIGVAQIKIEQATTDANNTPRTTVYIPNTGIPNTPGQYLPASKPPTATSVTRQA